MRTRVRYVGRVQGVGFRATVRMLMGRHPVTGWVRNEPDGSVLLEVQGDAAAVHAALAEVRETMGHHIRSEDASPIDEVADERGFEITH